MRVRLVLLLFAISCAVSPGDPTEPAQHGFGEERLARITAGMQQYVDDGRIAGVVTLVHRRGQDAHVDVLGWQDAEAKIPMRRDTIFRIYSMTKPITSVAVLILLEEGELRLTDAVDRWLPELADPQVLRDPESALDDTLPAKRPITVRDLLTHTSGLAYSMTAGGALGEALTQAWSRNEESGPDEWLRRHGSLPLAYEPGTRWNYSISTDVLGILVARVAEMPFEEFLRQRLFEPLEMKDTAFYVPEMKLDRFAVNYTLDPETNERVIFDHPTERDYTKRPSFASGGGGLVSTADDYSRFARMVLNGGQLDGTRILSRKSVELMTQNALTPEERDISGSLSTFMAGRGFGLGVSVVDDVGLTAALGSAGSNGWGGAAGTIYTVDFQEELVAIFMVQHMNLRDIPIGADFMNLVYQAIED